MAAVDDNLVEATLESFPGQALSVTSTATASQRHARWKSPTTRVPAWRSWLEQRPSLKAARALVTVTYAQRRCRATLAVPVSANLPTGHADYTPTGVTFAVTTGSGATLDISVAAVDDNLVEATLESFRRSSAEREQYSDSERQRRPHSRGDR